MGTKTRHFQLHIESAAMFSKPEQLGKLFQNEDETYVDWKDAKKFLFKCMNEGKVYLPIGNCDNFDFQKGCMGHDVEVDEGLVKRNGEVRGRMSFQDIDNALKESEEAKIAQMKAQTFKAQDGMTVKECEPAIEKLYTTEPGDDLQCWITTRGHIIPVPFHQHDAVIDELMDRKLLAEDIRPSEIESTWMKVSRVNSFEIAVYHEGVVTAKQKIALTRIMEKFKDEFFKERDYFMTYCKKPLMTAVLKDSKVTFTKD